MGGKGGPSSKGSPRQPKTLCTRCSAAAASLSHPCPRAHRRRRTCGRRDPNRPVEWANEKKGNNIMLLPTDSASTAAASHTCCSSCSSSAAWSVSAWRRPPGPGVWRPYLASCIVDRTGKGRVGQGELLAPIGPVQLVFYCSELTLPEHQSNRAAPPSSMHRTAAVPAEVHVQPAPGHFHTTTDLLHPVTRKQRARPAPMPTWPHDEWRPLAGPCAASGAPPHEPCASMSTIGLGDLPSAMLPALGLSRDRLALPGAMSVGSAAGSMRWRVELAGSVEEAGRP